MKKFLLLIVALLCCLFFFIGSSVKVQSGSTAFLKEKAKAVVTFDYSKTVWENKDDFKTWCGNEYESRIGKAAQSFVESFNKTSKGLQVSTDATDAKYEIKIIVDKFESLPTLFSKQGKTYVSGVVSVVDRATNQVVCTFNLQRFGYDKPAASDNITDAIVNCYSGLAEELTAE